MRFLILIAFATFTQISIAHETCKTDWFEANISAGSITISESTLSELDDAMTTLGLTFPIRFDRQNLVCHVGEGPNYCESGMFDNGRIYIELSDANLGSKFSQLFKCN